MIIGWGFCFRRSIGNDGILLCCRLLLGRPFGFCLFSGKSFRLGLLGSLAGLFRLLLFRRQPLGKRVSTLAYLRKNE